MALSLEQADSIKAELLKQLGKFPEEKREEIKQKVQDMPASEVEDFVKENDLTHLADQCMFCSIITGKNPSFKIGEDDKNIAILDINPISRGHALIVPKNHAETIEEHSKTFASTIAEMLKEKLKPGQVSVADLNIMGHALLQVVPIFGDEKERWQATPEELQALQAELTKPKEVVILPSAQPKPQEPEEDLNAPMYKLPPKDTIALSYQLVNRILLINVSYRQAYTKRR